ncbi:MAG: hypothetical protein ACLFSW_04670 [Halobacteriales archaeon]
MQDDGYPEVDLHRRHSDGFRESSMPLGDVPVWEPSSRFDRFCVVVFRAGKRCLSHLSPLRSGLRTVSWRRR